MGLFKGRGGKENPPDPEPESIPSTVEQALSPLHLTTSLAWYPEQVKATDGDGDTRHLKGCTLRIQARPPNTVENVTYEFFFDMQDIGALPMIAMAMANYAARGEWQE